MDEDKTAPSPSGSKPQRKYERKTKRFIWPDELHRLFLMEAAGPNSGLTTEHLKSHLQKYRLNYERSRLEFLEFYDRSAKRNLKRRRRHAQHRAGGGAGEANTMFVFPISNSKRHKGRDSDSDSDDSDSDRERGDGNDNNDTNMEVDVRRGKNPTHPAPQGHSGTFAAAEAQARSLGFSQLVQSAQSNSAAYDTSGNGRQPPQLSNDRLLTVATSVGMPSVATQHFPPDYAAASETQRTSSTDRDRELAAAAVAVAAYRYPLGQLPMAGAVGGAPGSGGMPELTDPQWNILNSLMSPPLAGMSGLGGEGAIFAHTPQVSTVPVTSEAMGRGGSDTFMLQEEPSDLQMQMHLAMQAQMNLHRQMLTRKVEVSQHLARHSRTEEGAGMATESKSDDDSLDLYRWDRIDLNVELEDDDLFGFLKS
ncbi:hypothetical protein BBJ28_00016542 [Nothophytophthora sp. Chile5]|nr:hypothetical protein BBJ28_00016542 [Nothophytophthora sp. Chile5]